MKKLLNFSFYGFLLLSFMAISSCSKPLTVYYNLTDQIIDVPANPNNTYQVFTYTINHSDVAAALTAAGVADAGRVTKAGLKTGFKAHLETTGVNLDNISNIEVYMKNAGSGGTGDMVAYSDAKANGATEVGLLINGAELKQAVATDQTVTVKVLSGTSGSGAMQIKLTSGVLEITVKN